MTAPIGEDVRQISDLMREKKVGTAMVDVWRLLEHMAEKEMLHGTVDNAFALITAAPDFRDRWEAISRRTLYPEGLTNLIVDAAKTHGVHRNRRKAARSTKC